MFSFLGNLFYIFFSSAQKASLLHPPPSQFCLAGWPTADVTTLWNLEKLWADGPTAIKKKLQKKKLLYLLVYKLHSI